MRLTFSRPTSSFPSIIMEKSSCLTWSSFLLFPLQCLGKQHGGHRQQDRAGHGPGQEPLDVCRPGGGGSPQGANRRARGEDCLPRVGKRHPSLCSHSGKGRPSIHPFRSCLVSLKGKPRVRWLFVCSGACLCSPGSPYFWQFFMFLANLALLFYFRSGNTGADCPVGDDLPSGRRE